MTGSEMDREGPAKFSATCTALYNKGDMLSWQEKYTYKSANGT